MPLRVSVILFMCAAAFFAAEAPAEKPITPDHALDRLTKAYVFGFGGIGFAGTIPEGEIAFRALLARSSAARDFEAAFVRGTPQAKAYALVGLREVNSNRFAELAGSLQASSIEVQTMQGCLMNKLPMSKLVERIKAGEYSSPKTRKPVP
ncbi:MAG: hypothetical protein ACJ746_06725 [Bryobacteraceae bacterium]